MNVGIDYFELFPWNINLVTASKVSIVNFGYHEIDWGDVPYEISANCNSVKEFICLTYKLHHLELHSEMESMQFTSVIYSFLYMQTDK